MRAVGLEQGSLPGPGRGETRAAGCAGRAGGTRGAVGWGRVGCEERGPHCCHRPAPQWLTVSHGLRDSLGEGVRGLGAERDSPHPVSWDVCRKLLDFFALGCGF